MKSVEEQVSEPAPELLSRLCSKIRIGTRDRPLHPLRSQQP
ncbi:hypothetical protein AK812_SmicGene47141, partial [Symbiodinium microadriaticum]